MAFLITYYDDYLFRQFYLRLESAVFFHTLNSLLRLESKNEKISFKPKK